MKERIDAFKKDLEDFESRLESSVADYEAEKEKLVKEAVLLETKIAQLIDEIKKEMATVYQRTSEVDQKMKKVNVIVNEVIKSGKGMYGSGEDVLSLYHLLKLGEIASCTANTTLFFTMRDFETILSKLTYLSLSTRAREELRSAKNNLNSVKITEQRSKERR